MEHTMYQEIQEIPASPVDGDARRLRGHALQIVRNEHRSLTAVLRSLLQMLARGPEDAPERFFDVLRAMLFYIDEFPEQLHHPKESDLLFPRVLRRAPELMPVIEALERDHMQGQRRVRELQHLLLAWELLGDVRRPAFEQAATAYVDFYLAHVKQEESQVLPVAERVLLPEDWDALDRAFGENVDPLASGQPEARYQRLFTRIVLRAPAPIGVGPS
jgi:hemerythrin-like domain-containing protein